jgi:hypothetical protein
VIGQDGRSGPDGTVFAESEHLNRLVEDLLLLTRLEADASRSS